MLFWRLMGNGKKVMGAVLYSMKEEKKSHGRNNKQKLKKKEVMRPTVQSMPLQLFLKYLKDKIIFKNENQNVVNANSICFIYCYKL